MFSNKARRNFSTFRFKKKPRYGQTSAYGHFGRELDSFTWEKVDMVEELQKYNYKQDKL